jgi:predicted metalloendopeptidase
LANYFATHVVLNFGQYTTTNMIELLVDKLDAPEVLPNICYGITEKLLPDLLGRVYLDNYYRQNSREDMKFLISLLHESFYQLFEENNWMDSHTKQKAINKLDSMSQNIAYPEWTMDDIKLELYYDKVNDKF